MRIGITRSWCGSQEGMKGDEAISSCSSILECIVVHCALLVSSKESTTQWSWKGRKRKEEEGRRTKERKKKERKERRRAERKEERQQGRKHK